MLPLARAEEVCVKPAGFIFHMARCGSTLACRMLQATSQVLVLSEPLLIQTLLYGGQISSQERVSYLRRLLGLYQKGLSQDHQGMVIKWSSACTRHIELIQQAFPGVPCLFIHRHPEEVLMSYLKGRPEGWHLADQHYYAPHLQPPTGSNFLETAARYMASTCYFATQGQGLHRLDYQTMPSAVAIELPQFFGLDFEAKHREAMLTAAKFYSKDASTTVEFDRKSELILRVPPPEVTEVAQRIVWPEIQRLKQSLPHI